MFPNFEIFALVADYGKGGSCLTECAFDGDALRTLADALNVIDDNTVGIVRINFAEKSVDDVSEDAARLWMKTKGIHHEWLHDPVPPFVERILPEEVEEEIDHAGKVARGWSDYWRAEKAYFAGTVQ